MSNPLPDLKVFTPEAMSDDEKLWLHWRQKHAAKPAERWTKLLGSRAWKAWVAGIGGAVAPVIIAALDGSIDEQLMRTAIESAITATALFVATWVKANAEPTEVVS